MKKLIMAVAIASTLVGCARIETGEVGLRVGFDKQVNLTELQTGSFNQVFIGDVLTFPVRDISLEIKQMTPQTADNSTMADVDLMIIYNINPASVGEIFTTKSRGFHAYHDGDVYLMYEYMTGIVRSATYKAVRKHDALKVADNRQVIEADVATYVRDALKEEKLDTSITISQVQVRNVQPNAAIIASANEVLQAQNALKTKEIEVKTAEAEARKQMALSNVGEKSLALMRVQNEKILVEAIAAGKVNTIVVPSNFTMLGAVK
jgi:regulator of protease activity HflC (stomatin/prohibitin superfamily)